MAFKYLVPITLVIALSGCGSIGAVGVPWGRDRQIAQQPQPLPPPSSTMTAPVQTATLPPLDATGQPTSGLQTYGGPTGTTTTMGGGVGVGGSDPMMSDQPLAPPAGTQTAMTSPSSGGAVGRTDLLGGWTITSGSDSCQLFMTLTSWTGGYRASTRGCTSDMLKSISAWNLQGASVVLAGQGGSPLATLASSGSNRFDGQANGQPVSFYR